MSKLTVLFLFVLFSFGISAQKKSFVELENAGNQFIARGDYDRAIESFSELIEKTSRLGKIPDHQTTINSRNSLTSEDNIRVIDPRTAHGLLGRGRAFLGKGDRQSAFSDFDRAIRIAPAFSEAYFFRGYAFIDEKNFEAAELDFDRYVKLQPKRFEGYIARGVAKIGAGKNRSGFDDLDQAVKMEPKSAMPYIYRGEAFLKIDRDPEALADFERAIALDPKRPEPLLGRGIIRLKKEAFKEAVEDFSRALILDPHSKVGYANRCVALIALGRKDAAMADLEQLRKLYPEAAQVIDDQLRGTNLAKDN